MAELPPNYSSEATRSSIFPPQLVIAPAADSVHFQSGNLGAEGETATVEGEVQLKGFNSDDWESISITLKTVEKAESQAVELCAKTVELFTRKKPSTSTSSSVATLPSSLPFSIPLTSDVPQEIRTPISSIAHSLTATLHPAKPGSPPFSKTIPIQIRRSTTANSPTLSPAARSFNRDDPTPFKIQLPRAVFRSGEMIPIYFSVPPPATSVPKSGVQLRNVKVELVRTVKVGPVDAKGSEAGGVNRNTFRAREGTLTDQAVPDVNSNGYPVEKQKHPDTIRAPPLDAMQTSSSRTNQGTVFDTVITRSGASCRFHSRRTVQLRLVLHTSNQSQLDDEDQALPPEVDSAAGSITQSTVLHQVDFHVHAEVSFVNPSNHTSNVVRADIPITIIPALAPPQETDDLEVSYRKKHDQPPTTTTTRVTEDNAPPAFDDESGRTIAFEGNNAGVDPPPFSAEPSNMGLPSFSESQSQAEAGSSYPGPGGSSVHPPGWQDSTSSELRFDGEGELFGFRPEDQYDGLSHSLLMNRSSSPPPALDSSVNDQNVTELAPFINPSQGESVMPNDPTIVASAFPPPPPALDDPLDLPPTIDERFSSLTLDQNPVRYRATGPDGSEPMLETPTPGGGDGGPPPYLGGAADPLHSAPPAYLDTR
ncbi:hypothetical protein FRC04_005897 [Tulasnella sp. 424]|nr:hypothetical protein FRC04_005897 [Tulasnella sp. 424]KAG8976041.1 hypothetical protein FRC05_004672 [Tulasnella sp. 425]